MWWFWICGSSTVHVCDNESEDESCMQSYSVYDNEVENG